MNQTTMMNMSLTHPATNTNFRGNLYDATRWQAGDCTWTTPASENLETPEVTQTAAQNQNTTH